MVEVTDTGFTPENIADAEWLWLNMNIDHRKFHELPTAHKAMLCHTTHRHRQAGVQQGLDMAAAYLDGFKYNDIVMDGCTMRREWRKDFAAAIRKLGGGDA